MSDQEQKPEQNTEQQDQTENNEGDRPPEPKRLRPERVSYQVSRDEPPCYAQLVVAGADIGKYRDERSGLLYDSSSDWIRAMNTSIPLGM
mmetsp:Transcript_15116/g.25986  ORF Transcript_15116/g.25986 Transcript_15116/m.25986 type:complete len:90 (-) Transcript_15116:86-355(-)